VVDFVYGFSKLGFLYVLLDTLSQAASEFKVLSPQVVRTVECDITA
jgi:hypothetical protein